jgi:hypothetical protein
MIGKIRLRLSSAHLIGLVALVFAVGGGFALANVPADSVGAGKLKRNAVHFKHIFPGSVHYSKLSRGLQNRINRIGTGGGPGTPGAPGAPGTPGTPGSAIEGRATADAGDALATILDIGGFRFRLACNGTSEIELLNVSGGDNSAFELIAGSEVEDNNFDESDFGSLVDESGGNIESVIFSIVGSNGTLLNGQATVMDNPATGFGGADCVGLVTVV